MLNVHSARFTPVSSSSPAKVQNQPGGTVMYSEHLANALFRSQNTKYKIFINHLYGILNIIKNKSHYTNGL